MTAPLIARVGDLLRRSGVPYALIGAGALAVHGVSRSTLDQDLLATDSRVLADEFWSALQGATAEVRVGDRDDPLAGVVRIAQPGERDVDVVVGRQAWQNDAITRAMIVQTDFQIPVVRAADLILLKLYAGGTQDMWDIEQLLAAGDAASLCADVERSLAALPARSRELWSGIRP
jgi:hypothetical protein